MMPDDQGTAKRLREIERQLALMNSRLWLIRESSEHLASIWRAVRTVGTFRRRQ